MSEDTEYYLRGSNMKNRCRVLALATKIDGTQMVHVRWRVEGFHSQEAWETLERVNDLIAVNEVALYFVPLDPGARQ